MGVIFLSADTSKLPLLKEISPDMLRQVSLIKCNRTKKKKKKHKLERDLFIRR